MANSPLDWLRLKLPITGRQFREDGSVVNVADIAGLKSLLDPPSISARKQAYFFQDLRESIAQGDVYYYRFKAPADKHIVIFNRDIRVGAGPVRFETVVGVTSFTPGAPRNSVNLYTGGPSGTAEIEAGAIPADGTEIPADYIFSEGNNNSPTAASNDLVTILPPGLEIFTKLTNEAQGTNAGIRFALAFAEVLVPDAVEV